MTRNTSLDVLKGVAALFVIWIHEQFPGVTGQLIDRIGAFAVPVFFMVSGFFSHGASREKLLRSIRHILTLIAIAYGLNLLRLLVFDGGAAMLDALIGAFSPRTLILWILLNITPISGVAWFLFALLYCYILHWMFHGWMKERRVWPRGWCCPLWAQTTPGSAAFPAICWADGSGRRGTAWSRAVLAGYSGRSGRTDAVGRERV